ncbi:MAG TPA: hypothetical protein VF855_11680 [Acidimicrobiales bacterium]
MFIFGRRRRINPAHARAAIATSVEIAGRVSSISGRHIHAWMSVASGEAGTMLFSTRLDTIDDLTDLFDKVSSDNTYGDWIESHAGEFDGPATDTLNQIVHGTPSGEMPAYVMTTAAELANGHFADGMALGIAIADAAHRIAGANTVFAKTVTGSYAGVGWLTPGASLGALQAFNETLNASAEWIDLIERAGNVYAPGAQTTILRRLT